MKIFWILIIVLGVVGGGVIGSAFSQNNQKSGKTKMIKKKDFIKLMQQVSDGWNEGNARKAADCFAEDAIYTEPPDKQVYVGKQNLFEFFGGDEKPEPPMKMQWHHLAFDEETQIGFGEYTFQMNKRYHGIVIVKVKNGKVSNWREYQSQSNFEWDKFTQNNKF